MMDCGEVTMWQCDKTLTQCLRYILENEIAFDIEFMCGKTKNKVRAHSFILKSRSPVFYAMLGKQWPDEGSVVVKDIEGDTFMEFLRYLYTDDISISTENVVELRYAARKYCVDLLAEKCLQFINSYINAENACTLLEKANINMDEEIFLRSLLEIEKNTFACIRSKSFLCLSKHCIQLITESDELNIDEQILLDYVLKWRNFQCSLTKRPICDVCDVINNIRFPLIDLKCLQQFFKKNFVIDEQEKNRLLSVCERKENDNSTGCPTKKRKGPSRILRFSSHSEHQEFQSEPVSVSFSLSEESYLHGVLLFGTKSAEDIKVVVKTATGDKICSFQTVTCITSSCEEISDVFLPSSVLLKGRAKYKLLVSATALSTTKGIGRIEEVCFSDYKLVQFHETTIEHNGLETYREHGQIPGLILS